jgi:hypothetical protein
MQRSSCMRQQLHIPGMAVPGHAATDFLPLQLLVVMLLFLFVL